MYGRGMDRRESVWRRFADESRAVTGRDSAKSGEEEARAGRAGLCSISSKREMRRQTAKTEGRDRNA
jgi:hypothetical protein